MIRFDLKQILINFADEKGFEIKYMEIEKDDHINLLVSALFKLSVIMIVSHFKSIAALRLFKTHPELQKMFWSLEYFVESIETTNQDVVAKYIDVQRKKSDL